MITDAIITLVHHMVISFQLATIGFALYIGAEKLFKTGFAKLAKQ